MKYARVRRARVVSEIVGDKGKLLLQNKIHELFKERLEQNKTSRLDDFFDSTNNTINNKFLKAVNYFFVFYSKPYNSIFEFKTMGEYIDYIKNNQIYTLNARAFSLHPTDR